MDAAVESTAIIMSAWNVMAKASPSFETRRGDLVDVSWMGHPCPFFNLAATARPLASIEAFKDAVAATSRWASERRMPWLFTLCHDLVGGLLGDCQRELERLGFVSMMPLTGMEADELLPPARSGMTVEYLTEADSSIGDKVIRLNEAAYQMKFGEPGSLVLEAPGWWKPPSRMATVIVHEGRPVSCATVLDAANTRYVALVATLPGEQRKGYAEAAMRNVLDRSRAAGLNSRTYLHASAAGKPVYLRMGYKTTAEYAMYIKQA
jgi:hypothetical protein